MQDNSNAPMSVTQALNQIQSWLNAGEYDKVIQGCQEILQLEPGNQRALALMKQAEEKRHEHQMPNQAAPETSSDPLAELQVEESPASEDSRPKPTHEPSPQRSMGNDLTSKQYDSNDMPDFHGQDFHMHEKRTMFLAMLIPAILVVVIGGGIIWYLNSDAREDVIDGGTEIAEESNYIADNEERVTVLTKLEYVLDEYYAKHDSYPAADEIESIVKKSDYFDEVPVDPLQDEFDKAGKTFGYTYAVYDTIAGENTAYIVSALFEDSRGFGYAWSRGASTKNYDDYRKVNQDNVTYIGGDEEGGTDNASEGSQAGPKRNTE